MTQKSNLLTIITWSFLVLGIWLIIAPFILGYLDSAAITNDILIGFILAAISLVRTFSSFRPPWLDWIDFIVGGWLILAPLVLNYAFPFPQWNDIIIGLLVIILGLGRIFLRRKV